MAWNDMPEGTKRQSVEKIAKVAGTLMVKNAAEAALRGEASMDSALVTARETTNQGVVRDIANRALGMDKK